MYFSLCFLFLITSWEWAAASSESVVRPSAAACWESEARAGKLGQVSPASWSVMSLSTASPSRGGAVLHCRQFRAPTRSIIAS